MNRMPISIPLLTLGALLAAGAAQAEDTSGTAAPGRYSMQKTDSGGIARLDTQTGEVSLCQEKDQDIVCRMAADERTAFELELDLLTKRVETLENTVANGQAGSKLSLPSMEEIDRTMGVIKRMMRDFKGIVKDLDTPETPPSGPADDLPKKT